MKIVKNICLYFTCVLLGFHVTTGPVFAQILLTTLQDVLQSPDRYYAQQIKVKGKIVEVKIENKGEETSSGTYLLRDSKGTEVTVFSEILPIAGKTHVITLEVQKDMNSSVPRFREVNRTQSNRLKYIGYALGAVGLIFIVSIVFGGTGNPDNPGA